MSHVSDLSIGIDETIAAMLRAQSTAHKDIAGLPGPRSLVHAELADRYALLARRVERGIDWAAEGAEEADA